MFQKINPKALNSSFCDKLIEKGIKKNKVDYDLKDAKKNMKVLDATFKSIKKGSWVKV